jgi:2-keto-3-deoxy-galactonokinase
VVLSLGSHWKAVRVDAGERVTSSVSTLSGELIHAVRSQTILASAVPGDWPATLPAGWVEAGFRRGRADGLPRAFYCVRLLDQRAPSTPGDRLGFLVGATIAADEETLLPAPTAGSRTVVLLGAPALVEAWAGVIRQRGVEPITLSEDDREAAFRAGCLAVLAEGRLDRGPSHQPTWRRPRASDSRPPSEI